LHRSLLRFKTAAHWREYLALPKEMMQSERAREGDLAAPDPVELAALKDVLTRFDLVRDTHEYRIISGLSEFAVTHERLAAYVDHLTDAREHPREGPVEELPAPESERQ
jgi:hypothetical protein